MFLTGRAASARPVFIQLYGSTGAPGALQGSGAPGWIYDNVGTDVNSFLGNVFAAGFNEQTGLLAHEVGP